MKAGTGEKKKSYAILAASAGIFLIALSLSGFFLVQIIGRMNLSANQNLLISSRVIRGGLNNEIVLDRKLLGTLAELLALEQEDAIGETLEKYADSTDFFRFSFVDVEGNGIDSQGNTIHASDLEFSFDDTAGSQGLGGISTPYHGSSGWLQVTFQHPVMRNGKQIGDVYADRIINDYNLPNLFSFHNGEGSAYVVDSQGNFIIKSRGTSSESNIYSYLENQGNSKVIQDTLRQVIGEHKSGTLAVMNGNQKSLLGFLPADAPEGCYLLTVVPRTVLQQEAAPIITMLCCMFCLLLLSGIAIAALLAGRQSMKADVLRKEYREKLFENLSSNIDFAFLLYTPAAGKVELVSENLPGLLGITAQEVREKPELVFDAGGMAKEDTARNGFLKGMLKEQITRESLVGAGPNQVRRWIEIHLIPADYGQYLAVFHETTGEHDIREQLADALTQAQNSNRARTEFFSSMSHEIRTPMNGIMGMTNIALKNLDDREKTESCLNKIMAASEHLLGLINEVLDMSRIESGKLSLKEENVNLPSLIANLVSFIKPEMDKKNQVLYMKSPVLEHDTVLSDTLHLQKILLNLLSNAVKYTQEGGEIRLMITENPMDADTIGMRFVVADNGIGMSPEFLECIFKPFERAEDSRMSQVTGTGLGLAITKSIVDMMGGSIRVESRKNKGSRFTVDIPLKLPVQPEQPEQEIPDLTQYSALVVDDDQDACEGICLILQEIGIRARWVLNGPEAVKQAWDAHVMKKDYGMLIVDMKMPGMDGLETARQIRKRLGSKTPILLLSAYDWECVKDEAVLIGINGFLTKPIFKNELLGQLAYFFQGRKNKTEESAPEDWENLNGVSILAAEDNELNREIIVELLESHGAVVDTACNGKEALDAYLNSSPGYYRLILMDVHMPEMNGLEATKAIRDSGRPDAATVPVIAMTADVFKEDIRRCREAGMDAHIGKPVELDKLFSTLQRFLNKQQEPEEI
ncbi:hybrid sensor histidine kinase/response regulator [Enterocloster sp.]|uniref:hybrid sensor histidine kinase/response regulator n=1 Tax=Enterocloster sp. TaxID=2719315 RepID=UPI00257DD336|nr:response regulator [Enterocloster sp.]MBS5404308.1 response regulator [Enterocloster sp.]